MPKPIEKLLLLTIDFITIQVAFWGLLQLRTSLHLFAVPGGLMQLQVSLVIYVSFFRPVPVLVYAVAF